MSQQLFGWLIVSASVGLWLWGNRSGPQLSGIAGWLGTLLKRTVPIVPAEPEVDHSASDIVFQFEVLRALCLKHDRAAAANELNDIFSMFVGPDPRPNVSEITTTPAEPKA